MRYLLAVALSSFALVACRSESVTPAAPNSPQAGFAGYVGGAAAGTKNCFHTPGACGYPDPAYGTVGVPRGIALTHSGSIVVTVPGTVLTNLDVDGSITIEARDTTIRNVRVTLDAHGSGTAAIWIESGARDTTIENATIRGIAAHRAPESAIFNHSDEPLTLTRVYVYNFADPLEGPANIRDSYLDSNGTYGSGSGIAHIEDVYASDSRVTVDRSVLFNPWGQTATVFMDTKGGQGGTPGDDRLAITNSLLAGGGWTLYPSAKSTSVGTGRMNVSSNRFARCLTAPVYDKSSGGTSCRGGPDTHGYYPYSGYYGIAADLYCPPVRRQSWSANVWDDDGSPIPCP